MALKSAASKKVNMETLDDTLKILLSIVQYRYLEAKKVQVVAIDLYQRKTIGVSFANAFSDSLSVHVYSNLAHRPQPLRIGLEDRFTSMRTR